MFAMVPENVIVASAVPSPTENVRPVMTGNVIVPFVAVNVICTAAGACIDVADRDRIVVRH